jgi:CheY-like chemotaxis protein
VARIVVTSTDGSVEVTIDVDRRYFDASGGDGQVGGFLSPETRDELLARVGDAARQAVQADVEGSAHVRDEIRLPSAGPGIRVYICEDDDALRQLLRVSLEEDGDIRVVGDAGDGRTGVEGIEVTQPDIVVLDLGLPGLDGIDAIPLIRRGAPDAQIIVFSGFQASQWSGLAMRLGVARYVEKGASMDEVCAAVRDVAAQRRAGRPVVR